MENQSVEVNLSTPQEYSKIAGFVKLTKFRLSILVVFSAVISYFTVFPEATWAIAGILAIGGFLVTASANTYNQIIERDLDKLMKRTCSRPIPTNTLSPRESFIFATICGALGVGLLYFFIHAQAGILSLISIGLYALVYTPLKRMTPFSVFVGAIPGALPTLIGGIAGETDGKLFTLHALLLYLIQFFWQFPHFWAIAWVSHDDYKKAGFLMLPSPGGRDQSSLFQILIYTLFLIPISLTPCFFGLAGNIAFIIISLCGILFFIQALRLYKKADIQSARQLMFGSFLYLPIVQLALMFKY